MTNSNATAIMEKDEAIDSVRKIPKVYPGHVQVNNDGFSFRSLMVRLPKDAIVDDLKSPILWSQTQLTPQTALRKFDHVLVVAFDESWAAQAIVSQAGPTGATLSGLRLITMTERNQSLMRDEKYYISWEGAGYCVRRNKDNQLMSNVVQTLSQAETDLRRLYPRPV